MKKPHSALDYMDELAGDDAEFQQMANEESLNLHIAAKIYAARTAANLSQKQLADLVGTGQSAIARLENADYAGHSLNMLKRVAKALGYRIELDLVKIEDEPKRQIGGLRKAIPKAKAKTHSR